MAAAEKKFFPPGNPNPNQALAGLRLSGLGGLARMPTPPGIDRRRENVIT